MKAFIIALSIILIAACTCAAQKNSVPGPHIFIYKSKKDYHNLVPVVLSEDKMKIISYPDPSDFKVSGNGLKPQPLRKGYFMSNSGVSINTAFLKFTYAEYAQLKQTPSPDELYKMIADKNPLTILYDCGLKASYKNPVVQFNKLINKNNLQMNCKSLKNTRP